MTSTARQLRQPPTIEAIERVLYFADVHTISRAYVLNNNKKKRYITANMRSLIFRGCVTTTNKLLCVYYIA